MRYGEVLLSMISTFSLPAPRVILWLSLASLVADCNASDVRRVIVGVGERFSAKRQIRQTLTAPKGQHRYLAEHTAAANGALPPTWLQKWVSADLSGHGYLPAGTSRATLWLVFEWSPLDPAISHFGRPAQSIDVRGRKVLEGGEVRRDGSETVPFCTVTAFDIAEVLKPAAERTPVWRVKMWPIFVTVPLGEKVEIGPLIFKEYVEPESTTR